MRLSDHNLDYLIKLATLYSNMGYIVVKPIYVDWWWRGYSIIMK